MDDLPVCKKCCFCLPLRYGLLLWGYLKLFSELLLLLILGLIAYILNKYLLDVIELLAVVFVTLSGEIVINIVFIIASHMKNVKLLRLYYYYSIFIWALTITCAVVYTVLIIVTMSGSCGTRQCVPPTTLLLVGLSTFIFAIAMQTFLLFVLRSEIIKLRSNCPYRFVKGTDDTEGVVKAEASEDKTTQLIDHQGTS